MKAIFTPEILGVLKVIKTLLLPIFAIFIGIYKNELFQFFFGTRKYKYLKGNWNTYWTENASIRYPNGREIPPEVIEIKYVIGKIVIGTGNGVLYGKYDFKGHISDSAIAIRYSGVQTKSKPHPGVFILKFNDGNQEVLNGFWAQSKAEEIVHGTTKWEKVENT